MSRATIRRLVFLADIYFRFGDTRASDEARAILRQQKPDEGYQADIQHMTLRLNTDV